MKQTAIAVLLAGSAAAMEMETEMGKNPIRKVVNLLQDMQKEVAAEGEKEDELFKKFMCYCKQNSGAQAAAAEEAEAEMNNQSAAATEATAAKEQTAQELDQHKADRDQDRADLEAATSQRTEEKTKFDKDLAQTTAEMEGCKKAIVVLEKGTSKAFLQTGSSSFLKSLVENKRSQGTMNIEDANMVLGFLQGDYHSVTGEIVGILKNMAEEFEKSIQMLNDVETKALETFGTLKEAKTASVEAATQAIEHKTEKKGELALAASEATAAADAAEKELADAQAFAAQLKESCATKEQEMEARTKERAEEIKAIGEAIEVLNDDDALDVFKAAVKPKEAPAMFLQMRVRKADPRSKALAMMQELNANTKSKTVHLVMQSALAQLKSKKADFGKIIAMIDDMVKLLTKEGKDDETTRDWCNGELNKLDEQKKSTETELAALATSIEAAEEEITTLKTTIETKTAEIKALDESVVSATETRKKEASTYQEEVVLNNTAIKLLNKAKNKLNKFYNPSMYVAPEQRELTEEERILQGSGQDIGVEATEAFSFAQVDMDSKASPPPPPETFGAYEKKGEKSNSVMALLDMIISDLNKVMTEGKMTEEQSQKDYEKLMADSASSRGEYVEIIADSEAAIAGKEEKKQADTEAEQTSTAFLAQTKEQIGNTHEQCDFIIENFDSRKEQRTTEIEGLTNAKAVLSGADFQ